MQRQSLPIHCYERGKMFFQWRNSRSFSWISWQPGCKCCMSRRQTFCIGCLSDTSTAHWAKYRMFFKFQEFQLSLDGNMHVNVTGVRGKPDAAAVFTDSLLRGGKMFFQWQNSRSFSWISWQPRCKCCMSQRQTFCIGCLSETSTAYWAKYSMFFKFQEFQLSLDGNTHVNVTGVRGKPDAAAVFTDSLL
jgi:hypothetical protein